MTCSSSDLVASRLPQKTLERGWELLALLPRDELHRVSDGLLQEHYRAGGADPGGPAAAGG